MDELSGDDYRSLLLFKWVFLALQYHAPEHESPTSVYVAVKLLADMLVSPDERVRILAQKVLNEVICPTKIAA